MEVIAEAIERATRTLEDGVSGLNHSDFANEFESYWNAATAGSATCYLGPGLLIMEAAAKVRKDNHLEIGDHRVLIRLGLAMPTDSVEPVLFVPLEGAIRPPTDHEGAWSGEDVRQMLAAAAPSVRAELQKLSRQIPPSILHLILQVGRPAGGESMVGLTLVAREPRAHPFAFGASGWSALRLKIERADHEYLVARGGGHAPLLKKSALVVGCGAVGGHVAFELARAGVSTLVLLDDETLSFDNLFRHVLGRRYVGRPKAEALRDAIRADLPFVNVVAIKDTFEAARQRRRIAFQDFDVLVFATGDPNSEALANRELWNLPGKLAVFAWVEPLGLGGHVIRTVGGEGGCLECTYKPWSEGGASRISFAAPGQLFSRSLTGCGSSFTPFGSMDASQTALLAGRLVIEALIDGGGPAVLSWKGSDVAFNAQFTVSDRWLESGPQTRLPGPSFRRPNCPVCGGA